MRSLLLIPALLAAVPACAQKTDDQLWLTATGSAPLGSGGTRVTVESIGRFSDNAGGFFHDEFGGMISVPVSKRIEIWAGYRHVDDYDHGRAKPNEERFRQVISMKLGALFVGRFRVEERFFGHSGEMGVRVRPSLRFTLPLGSGGVQFFAQQEHFVNLNTTGWGQLGGYERMRNWAGFSLPLSKRLRGDLGYLNQYRFGRHGARDAMDHAATFTLSLTL